MHERIYVGGPNHGKVHSMFFTSVYSTEYGEGEINDEEGNIPSFGMVLFHLRMPDELRTRAWHELALEMQKADADDPDARQDIQNCA